MFRWDDPVWRIIYPPNGFGCRCRVRALSGDQVSQQGLSVSSGSGQVVSKEVRLSADAPAVTVQGISGLGEKGGAFYPDPGWDYNPGDAQAAQLRLQRLAEQKADAAARPAKVKPLAFNTRTKAGEWHNAAFADSPDWLKRVLVREQSVRVQARSKGAWARGSELIDTDGCTKNARGLTTWRHEMGHILDYRLGRTTYVSSSAEFVKASALDARSVSRAKEARQSLASISPDEVGTVLNGVGATTEEFSRLLSRSTGQQVPADPATWKATAGARVEQLVSALAQRDAEAFVAALQRIERQDAAHVSLSDLVGSSTLNRACHPNQGFPGHTDDYYAKAASLYGHTESFANLTALAGHPLPIWWTLTKWFFPELTAVYERIIRSA